MKAMLSILALVFAAILAGCGGSGVGDPCTPGHPSLVDGGSSCAPGAGCFSASEVYIETRSLQCRTRVCMAYQWDEANLRNEQGLRVFCTCRCSGPGDPASFCTCDPTQFTCTTVFNTGNPGVMGGYCIRNEIPGIAPDAGRTSTGGGGG